MEVIIIPINDKESHQTEVSVESLYECLKDYANPALWPKEADAWKNHIAEKHATAPMPANGSFSA